MAPLTIDTMLDTLTAGVPLAVYSPVAATRATGEPSTTLTHHACPSETSSDHDGPSEVAGARDSDDLDEVQLHRAQRHSRTTRNPDAARRPTASGPTVPPPSLARFLADFTLGFADGLTVPFALTAGLSSLGRADTVVYAGAAELCAGSISMGIGGYLSARGERRAAAADPLGWEEDEDDDDDKDEEQRPLNGPGSRSEAPSRSCLGSAARYLEPLELPPALLELVVAHLDKQPAALASIESRTAEAEAEAHDDDVRSPVLAGLSVAVGYLSGGLLPLFPYLVVDRLGDGLLWSFVVCVVALFAFGFGKDIVLSAPSSPARDSRMLGTSKSARRWRGRLRRGVWEGAQMVLLGSVAALAAVLCVRLFEGMRVTKDARKL